jgi:hypothetical protein
LLAVLLVRKLPSVRGHGLSSSLARVLAASLGAAFLARAAADWFAPGQHAGGLERALPGIVGGLVFGASFVLLALVLRAPELLTLFREVSRRLRRSS